MRTWALTHRRLLRSFVAYSFSLLGIAGLLSHATWRPQTERRALHAQRFYMSDRDYGIAI